MLLGLNNLGSRRQITIKFTFSESHERLATVNVLLLDVWLYACCCKFLLHYFQGRAFHWYSKVCFKLKCGFERPFILLAETGEEGIFPLCC